MAKSGNPGISFELSDEQVKALKTIGGERVVSIGGKLAGNKVSIDFIACNSAFKACNSAFSACNSAFASCNSAFTAKK
jgi:hypothetical protein